MHPDRPFGAFEHRGDLRHRERGGVRCDDRVRADDRFERAKELVLDAELLVRCLDHDVAACELPELGREAEPPDRRVAGSLLELALLDLAGEEVADAVTGGLAA